MLAKWVVPYLGIHDDQIVKGVQLHNYEIIGDIVPLARRYADEEADESVLYDVTTPSDGRAVDKSWALRVTRVIDVPFCVAGEVRSLRDATQILSFGADKISINFPALTDPALITRLVNCFGVQYVMVGIGTWLDAETDKYHVDQYTGGETRTWVMQREIFDWAEEVQERGADEIVLNMMSQDGIRNGHGLQQLAKVHVVYHVPLIASGGAGIMEHLLGASHDAGVDGTLTASVFHKQIVNIGELKTHLAAQGMKIRAC